MSHRYDCPTRWQAEREGERAFERGYGGNPYRSQCRDAERAWDGGHRYAESREEDRRNDERRERARQDAIQAALAYHQRQEDDYWNAMEQQEMADAARAEEEAYYADEWRHALSDVPRWADDGGRET